jgi:hypothetical protein
LEVTLQGLASSALHKQLYANSPSSPPELVHEKVAVHEANDGVAEEEDEDTDEDVEEQQEDEREEEVEETAKHLGPIAELRVQRSVSQDTSLGLIDDLIIAGHTVELLSIVLGERELLTR